MKPQMARGGASFSRVAACVVAVAGGASLGGRALVGCGSNRNGGAPAAGANADGAAPDATLPDAGSPDGGGSVRDAATCATDAPPWTDPGIAPPTPDPTLTGQAHHFFKITVADSTGAPVVGAALTTTNKTVYTTDVNGVVAYYEPGLMGTAVYFTPTCAGYTYPADGFGNAGVALTPTEGGGGAITMTPAGTPTPPQAGDLQTRLLAGPVPGAAQCFELRFVDAATSRGVPLVKAVAQGNDVYWSDSQGIVAYCDPDTIGKTLSFAVTSDGYTFGGGATSVTATAGGRATLPLARVNVAERLYRVTGQGIDRDSILLGLTTPLANPTIDGLVMGQDTPSTNLHSGKILWIWQDTDRPAYPLGNFDSSGATSLLPGAGGKSPDLGVDTTYFVGSDGFSRGMVNTTETGGPIWLGQLVDVSDADGGTKMYGTYYVARPSNPSSALAVFDDETSQFDFVSDYPAGAVVPSGRPSLVRGASGAYAYWSNPVRFPATVAAVESPATYEVWSAYRDAGADASSTLATNADGTLAYAWTPGAPPVTSAAVAEAGVASGQVLAGHLTDVARGSNVQISYQVQTWNDYRKRFSAIVQQQFGNPSFLGEIWYAEGDTPLGPWVFARKVVTHDDGYTFYNPDIVPYFGEAGGRILFFDATYTATYTQLSPTPRYDYNEIMYRLDLDDARVVLPVAVYSRGAGAAQEPLTKRGIRPGDAAMAPAFFAYDRPAANAVPLAWSGPSCAARRLVAGGASPTTPVLYALEADDAGGAPTVPLYEYRGAGDAYVYSVEPSLPGFTRGAIVARVWPSPIQVALPVADFLGDLVADAGPDQCLAAAGGAGGLTPARLDASASRDLAGPITRYVWSDAASGCPIASGATATVMLGPGLHDVRLDVADAAGNASSDETIVAIGP